MWENVSTCTNVIVEEPVEKQGYVYYGDLQDTHHEYYSADPSSINEVDVYGNPVAAKQLPANDWEHGTWGDRGNGWRYGYYADYYYTYENRPVQELAWVESGYWDREWVDTSHYEWQWIQSGYWQNVWVSSGYWTWVPMGHWESYWVSSGYWKWYDTSHWEQRSGGYWSWRTSCYWYRTWWGWRQSCYYYPVWVSYSYWVWVSSGYWRWIDTSHWQYRWIDDSYWRWVDTSHWESKWFDTSHWELKWVSSGYWKDKWVDTSRYEWQTVDRWDLYRKEGAGYGYQQVGEGWNRINGPGTSAYKWETVIVIEQRSSVVCTVEQVCTGGYGLKGDAKPEGLFLLQQVRGNLYDIWWFVDPWKQSTKATPGSTVSWTLSMRGLDSHDQLPAGAAEVDVKIVLVGGSLPKASGSGTVCTMQYDPVCGVDGKTYSNACAANAAGVSIAYAGACTGSGRGTNPIAPVETTLMDWTRFKTETATGKFVVPSGLAPGNYTVKAYFRDNAPLEDLKYDQGSATANKLEVEAVVRQAGPTYGYDNTPFNPAIGSSGDAGRPPTVPPAAPGGFGGVGAAAATAAAAAGAYAGIRALSNAGVFRRPEDYIKGFATRMASTFNPAAARVPGIPAGGQVRAAPLGKPYIGFSGAPSSKTAAQSWASGSLAVVGVAPSMPPRLPTPPAAAPDSVPPGRDPSQEPIKTHDQWRYESVNPPLQPVGEGDLQYWNYVLDNAVSGPVSYNTAEKIANFTASNKQRIDGQIRAYENHDMAGFPFAARQDNNEEIQRLRDEGRRYDQLRSRMLQAIDPRDFDGYSSGGFLSDAELYGLQFRNQKEVNPTATRYMVESNARAGAWRLEAASNKSWTDPSKYWLEAEAGLWDGTNGMFAFGDDAIYAYRAGLAYPQGFSDAGIYGGVANYFGSGMTSYIDALKEHPGYITGIIPGWLVGKGLGGLTKTSTTRTTTTATRAGATTTTATAAGAGEAGAAAGAETAGIAFRVRYIGRGSIWNDPNPALIAEADAVARAIESRYGVSGLQEASQTLTTSPRVGNGALDASFRVGGRNVIVEASDARAAVDVRSFKFKVRESIDQIRDNLGEESRANPSSPQLAADRWVAIRITEQTPLTDAELLEAARQAYQERAAPTGPYRLPSSGQGFLPNEIFIIKPDGSVLKYVPETGGRLTPPYATLLSFADDGAVVSSATRGGLNSSSHQSDQPGRIGARVVDSFESSSSSSPTPTPTRIQSGNQSNSTTNSETTTSIPPLVAPSLPLPINYLSAGGALNTAGRTAASGGAVAVGGAVAGVVGAVGRLRLGGAMAVGSAAVSGASSAGHAVADGAGKAGGFLGGVWNFLTKKHDIPFASKPPSERNLIIDTALDWGLGISYNPQTAHYQTSILDTAINVVSVLGVGLIARGAGIGLRSAGAAIRALPGGVRALEVGSHLARPALEAAGKLARPAAELLGHTGARLGEATGHAKAALGGAARRAWNGFIDVGGKAASKAGQGASWLGSKVSSGLGSLVQRGGQKAAGAVNSAKEVALWSFEQGVQRVPDNFAKDVVRVGAGELKPWLNFAKREAETLGVKIEPSVHFLQNIGQHGTDLALTMPKHGFIGLSSDLLKGGVQQGAKLVTKADIPQLIEHEITHQGLRQGAPKVWEPISKLTQPAKELILENKMLNEKVTDIITSIRDPKVAKLAIDVSKYANPGKAFAATDEVIRYGQKLATTNPSPILRDAGKSLASGFQALKDTAVKSNTLLPAILPLPALSLLNPPKTQAPAPLPQAKQPAQEQKQSLLSSVTSGVKSALSGVKSALSGVGSALSSLIRIPKPQPAPQPSPVPSYTPVAQQAAKQTTSPNQQSYSPINQQAAKPTTSPSISYSPVSQQAAKPTATQPAAKPAPPQPAPPKPTPAYQSQPKPAPQQSPPKPSAPAPRAPAPVSRPAPAPAPRAPAPVSRPAPAPTPRAAPAPSNGNRGGGSNGGGSKGGGSKGRR